MEKPYWEGKEYSYFSHKNCEYFPCHKGADPENFNCLFCYCPLYALGDKCGGNFRFTESGIKDCTECKLPHRRENFGYVTGKYSELAEMSVITMSEDLYTGVFHYIDKSFCVFGSGTATVIPGMHAGNGVIKFT